jgi:MYXO-CTERM domain-containing protein
MIAKFLVTVTAVVCLAWTPASAQDIAGRSAGFGTFGSPSKVHSGLLARNAGHIAIDNGHRIGAYTLAVFRLPSLSIGAMRGLGVVDRAGNGGIAAVNATGMQNGTLNHASLAVVSEPTPTALAGIGMLALVGFGMLRRRQSAFLQR